ncbi:MAG: ATP-binding protein [bacterium]|nr:ATP-binding protein [bacterium]
MLSFTKGDPIAIAVDKNDNIKHIVRVRLDNDREDPDITADNILDILTSEDIDEVGKLHRLSRIEKQVLRKAVRLKTRHKLTDRLQESYDLLLDILNNKLKTELEFDNDLTVLPAYGYKDMPFDRHIFISAASGSGKSFFIAHLLKHDKRMRKVYLISKVDKDDRNKAFGGILIPSDDEGGVLPGIEDEELKMEENPQVKRKKKKRRDPNKRMKHLIIENQKDLMELPTPNELKEIPGGVILVFDDFDTFTPDMTDFIRRYMNDLLETGRKKRVSVISTSHRLRDYNRTKTNLSEAEWVVLFPSANKIQSQRFLKESLGMLKHERVRVIDKAAKNRYMAIKVSNPLAVIHQRGIILI